MKKILLSIALIAGFFGTQAQTAVYSESFTSMTFPSNMIRVNNDGKPAATNLLNTIQSNAWVVVKTSTGDTLIASTSWTNPVGAVDRWLITPPIPISSVNTVLRWRAKAQDASYPDGYEVYVRPVTSPNDTNIAGFTNNVLSVAAENASAFNNRSVNLGNYNGQTVRVAFRNNSNDKFVLYLDDIQVLALAATAGKVSAIQLPPFVDAASPNTPIKCTFVNTGANTATSAVVNYSINNGAPISQTFSGLNVSSFGNSTLNFTQTWSPSANGNFRIKCWVSSVNGTAVTAGPTDTVYRTISRVDGNDLPSRIVMFEHFTQASCGPCAAQNPAFTNLLNQAVNQGVTTSVKYHTSWPGVDPMNALNASEVATRVSYYNVSGVPNVNLGTQNIGSPTGVTQAIIDAEKVKKGLYDIVLGANVDSISGAVTVNATATPKVAMPDNGDMRLHLMMVEDPVTYGSAPGSNGETTFPTVFRKAFPNASGTQLWNSNIGGANNVTYTGYTIPTSTTFVVNNLYLIGFVQNHATKEIHQAAKVKLSRFITGVNNLSNSPIVNVYPNPANQTATLTLNLEKDAKVTFSVMNTLGQTVYTQEAVEMLAGNQNLTIPASELTEGIYLIQLTINGQAFTSKFQVKH